MTIKKCVLLKKLLKYIVPYKEGSWTLKGGLRGKKQWWSKKLVNMDKY